MTVKKPEPKDFLMWNGVDLQLYSRAFTPQCLETVLRFLETFKWDRKAEWLIRYLLSGRNATRTVTSRTVRRLHKKVDKGLQEPQPLRVVAGVCPRCGNKVRIGGVPSCESAETGRLSVKECGTCSYYSEIFIKNGEVMEIEGG